MSRNLDPDSTVPATSFLTTILHYLLKITDYLEKSLHIFYRMASFLGRNNKEQILLFIYFMNIIYDCTYIPEVYCVSIFH